MNIFLTSLALLAAGSVHALPLQSRKLPDLPTSLISDSGLQNAVLSLSAGGHAFCVQGDVSVFASTDMNQKILIDDFSNQTVVTETAVEFVQVNSTLPARLLAGKASVSDNFSINAKICYPLTWTDQNASTTIQFLVHGIAFDKSYWDFTEGYSYVDAAAVAGYATFSYDRLGTGASDHPDPLQIVQAPLEVEIAHSLIQSLRSGAFGKTAYSNVIAVGHSFGSIQSQAITADYPQDLDAVVLTGFSTNNAAMPETFVAFNPAIANENQPPRFSDLPNGYWVTDTSISNQLTFLRAPNFDPKNLALAEATKQTFTFGEFLTIGSVVKPATNFTGPVDVVNGENDFIFCQSNCNLPTDQSALVLKALYPASSNGSQSAIFPGVGHGINVHYDALKVYQHIFDFIAANGF